MMSDTERGTATRKTNPRRSAAFIGGFTLLELLISLTLLIVVVVITMGAMRLGSRSVAAGERKMDAQERIRTALSLIEAQIQSQLPLTYEDEGKRKYYFRGDKKSLRFATSNSIWSGGRGYAVVDYRVEADGSGRDVLSASEQIPGLDGYRNAFLLAAAGISFDYFYQDPTEETGAWRDRLPEGTAIPEKVRFHLNLTGEEIALIFPIRVRQGVVPVAGGVLP